MNLRIVHTFGKNAGDVGTFGKDVVRVGRAPDNDVAFDPDYDRDASGHHAEVRRDGKNWVLIDLESRNGTWIRGERVTRRELAAGDEVSFGAKGPRVRIEFIEAMQAVSGTEFGEPAAEALSGTPIRMGSQAAAGMIGALHAANAMARVRREMPPTATALVIPPEILALGDRPLEAPKAPPPPSARALPRSASAPRREEPRVEPVAAPPPSRAEARGVFMAEPAGKRVGQRTIAQMINSALNSVKRRPGATIELNAMVDRQVSAATAGQRKTARFLTGLLLFALLGLGALVLWSRRSHDEIDRLRGDLAKLAPEDPRRKEIEGRLGSLHPSNANFGRNLYDTSKKGIFMLVSGGEGFCTAFAVRPSVLATNAHCIFAARKHGGTVVALENEGHGQVSFPVNDMKAHPSYRDSDANALTPDVGIVNISGKAAIVLEMASASELAQMGAGDDVYLIGFPGRLMDASNPAATFLAAHVGRVTSPQGRPGSFAENWLVQHDAATTHGTSGSPIFNGRGKVVGINSGGYMESDDTTIAGRKTEVVRASPYKFGMRIDLLNAILR